MCFRLWFIKAVFFFSDYLFLSIQCPPSSIHCVLICFLLPFDCFYHMKYYCRSILLDQKAPSVLSANNVFSQAISVCALSRALIEGRLCRCFPISNAKLPSDIHLTTSADRPFAKWFATNWFANGTTKNHCYSHRPHWILNIIPADSFVFAGDD